MPIVGSSKLAMVRAGPRNAQQAGHGRDKDGTPRYRKPFSICLHLHSSELIPGQRLLPPRTSDGGLPCARTAADMTECLLESARFLQRRA